MTRTRRGGMRQDAGSSPAAPDAASLQGARLVSLASGAPEPAPARTRPPAAQWPRTQGASGFSLVPSPLSVFKTQKKGHRIGSAGPHGFHSANSASGNFRTHQEVLSTGRGLRAGASSRGALPWTRRPPPDTRGLPLTCLGGGARGSRSDKTGTTCIHKPVGPEAAQGGHPGVRTLLCCPQAAASAAHRRGVIS